MLLAVLGELGVGDFAIGVGGDHGNHLPRRRRLQNLIVGMIGGQDVNGASSLLTDADDTAGGLLGGLGIRWDIDKDDVGAVLLQVQAGGGDLHRRDENLHLVLGVVESCHRRFPEAEHQEN